MSKPDLFARRRFFDNQVHMKAWKDSMACTHEDSVIASIEDAGFKLDIDFVRQHPIGGKFVIDIAFLPEKIAIEVDGKSHANKKMVKIDKRRDRFLYDNGWVSIRVPENKFLGSARSFYKFLIREVVEARRLQLEGGRLRQIDVQEYKEEDYNELIK